MIDEVIEAGLKHSKDVFDPYIDDNEEDVLLFRQRCNKMFHSLEKLSKTLFNNKTNSFLSF